MEKSLKIKVGNDITTENIYGRVIEINEETVTVEYETSGGGGRIEVPIDEIITSVRPVEFKPVNSTSAELEIYKKAYNMLKEENARNIMLLNISTGERGIFVETDYLEKVRGESNV